MTKAAGKERKPIMIQGLIESATLVAHVRQNGIVAAEPMRAYIQENSAAPQCRTVGAQAGDRKAPMRQAGLSAGCYTPRLSESSIVGLRADQLRSDYI